MPPGLEATHGDFHEGQLFVSKGVITGLLDIDTIGPGRRADDLACMIAHLSTMQRMTAEQAAGLTRLINLWLQVFDTRVDPAELRLRAAGVIVSLATGPYRGQEPSWQAETVRMIESAVGLGAELRASLRYIPATALPRRAILASGASNQALREQGTNRRATIPR